MLTLGIYTHRHQSFFHIRFRISDENKYFLFQVSSKFQKPVGHAL